mgnify:CR=1 FL=1
MPDHIEQALGPYFEEGQRGLWTQLIEDQTDALLVAVLRELQELNGGGSPTARDQINPRSSSKSSSYISREVSLTTYDDKRIEFDFEVNDVLLYGADQNIIAAFKEPEKDDRDIPLKSDDLPYNVAPEGGLNTEQMWLRLQEQTETEVPLGTTVQVVAF